MSSVRPKLQLDEQSFQGLLAAAFTIQEHADLLKHVKGAVSKAAPEPDTAIRLCPRCAAPFTAGESRCSKCSPEELRPGERMQRRFASLWEMTQEHSVRQERPPEHSEESVVELASSGIAASPEPAGQSPAPASEPENPHHEKEWETGSPIEMDHAIHSIPMSILEEDSLTAAQDLDTRSPNVLRDLRQLLNLHRADFYLGIALLVAVFAFLWPAPVAPQKPRLEPWQRVLVKLGIAEAPAPQVHYRGDPSVQVWADPHTALYYCAGDEQYGKSADGHLTTQRDAQADQFQPANRAACN